MSREIDERIVSMKFDNQDFERNAAVSMGTLDKLKEKLRFSDVQDGLSSIDTTNLKKAFSGIGDVDSSKFNNIMDTMEYRMSNLGILSARIVENVADSIYGIVEKALSGIEKIVTYAEQGIVTGGYNRASNIQTSKFRLEGLGIAWEDIYGDIDYAVTNTAYALDQAALVASQLATSGIKPGQQYVTASGEERNIDTMAMILRSISASAAMSGGSASYDQIGRYFTNMLSRGKVYATELNELSGATGLNVRQVVADYMAKSGYGGKNDWTVEDISDLTKDSKFNDPMIIIEALYETYGDQATKANETLTGVMANTKSALARIGEDFFTPIIENSGPLVQLFEGLRQSLNDLRKSIQPVTIWMGEHVAGLLEGLGNLFMEKQYQVDEDGNIQRDENGQAIYKWGLKEQGGLFSSWLQPWTEEKEFKPFSDDVLSKIPDEIKNSPDFIGGTFEDAESRASRFLKNIVESLSNTGSAIKSFFEIIGDSFNYVFPNFKGISDVLVKISEKIKDITASWKEFMQSEKWENSNLHKIITGIFSGIDIVIRFGKSFKDHILDPIFGKGAEIVKASGLGDIIGDLFQKITDFDDMLKQEGNEDYFGKFFENAKNIAVKIKDAFKDAFDAVKQTFSDLKNIIFNTDLTWSDKWDSIKKYFTDNFELPGWSKIKEVFSGIGDAIDKVKEKIKQFFGFGGKDKEKEIYALGGGGGLISGAGPTLYYDKDDFINWDALNEDSNRIVSLSDVLYTIGAKLKSAFDAIKDAVTGFDIDTFQATLLAILAVLLLVIGGIIYLVAKLINAFTNFTTKVPKLLTDLLENLNGVLTKFSDLLGASAFKKKTEGIKNIIEAIGMLAGIILAVAGLTLIMKKTGNEQEMIDSLWQAGAIVGVLTVVVGTLSVVLVSLTKGVSSLGLVIDAANKNFTANLGGDPLRGISKFLLSLVISIGGLMAIIALASIGGWDWFRDGIVKVGILFTLIGALIFAVTRSMNSLSKTQAQFTGKVQLNAAAATITAVAGLITSVAVATLLLIPAIALLSIGGWDWFGEGMLKLALIGVYIGGLASVMVAIATAIGKWGQLKGGTLAAALFGIVAIILSTGAAVLAMAGAMKLISSVTNSMSGGDYAKLLGSLGAIVVILTAVPSVLSLIMTHNKSNYVKPMSSKELLAMSSSIIAMGAAVLAISVGLKLLSEESTGKILVSLLSIGIIFGEMIALFGVVGNMNVNNMTGVSGTMIKMSLSLLGISAALLLLSKFSNPNDLLKASIIVTGVMAAMMAIVIGSSWLIQRAGSLDTNTMLTLSKSMAYIALGTVPFIAAAVLVSKAMTDWNVNIGTMGSVFVGMAIVAGGLAILADAISKYSKNTEKINVSYLINSAVILTSVLPFMALTLIFAKGADMLDIDAKWILLSVVAIAGVVAAVSFGIKMISESAKNIGKIKTTDLLKNSIIMLIDIVGPIAAFAGALLLLKGIPVTQVLATAGSLVFMLSAIGVVTVALIEYARDLKGGKNFPNLVDKVKLVFGSLAVIVASTVAFAGAIRLAGNLSSSDTGASLMAIVALTGVAMAASVILIEYSKKIRGGEKTLPEVAKKLRLVLGSYILVSASMLVFAGAFRMMTSINSSEMWRSFGILSLMATITTGLSGILVTIAKINYSGYGQMGLVIATYASVTLSFIGFAAALNMLNKKARRGDLWNAAGILSVMGYAVSGITAILAAISKMKFDTSSMLTVIAGYASVSLGFAVFALALNKLRGIQFGEIKGALEGLLAVTALVGLIAALLTILSGDAATAASTGTILLGLGISMAGAGIFLLASSEGFKIFTEALMNLSGKSDIIVGGFTALNDGIIGGLTDFNEKLPKVLGLISGVITTTFEHILTVLPTRFEEITTFIRECLIAIGNLVNDPGIQNAFSGIITGLLDFLIKNAATWTEKLVELAGAIMAGLWKAIIGTPLPEDLGDFLGDIGSKINESLGGKITSSIDVIVDTNMNIQMAKSLNEWKDDIRESLHGYWIDTGRSEETFAKFINSKQGQDMVTLGVQYAIDPSFKKQVNEDYSGLAGLLIYEMEQFFNSPEGKLSLVMDEDAISQVDEARIRVGNSKGIYSPFSNPDKFTTGLPNGMTVASMAGEDYLHLTTDQLADNLKYILEKFDDLELAEVLEGEGFTSAWSSSLESFKNGEFDPASASFATVLQTLDEVYSKLKDDDERAAFIAYWQQAIEETFGYNIYDTFQENKARIESGDPVRIYYEFLGKNGEEFEKWAVDYVEKAQKRINQLLGEDPETGKKTGNTLWAQREDPETGESIYKYPDSVVANIPQKIRENGTLASNAYSDSYRDQVAHIREGNGWTMDELWQLYTQETSFYDQLNEKIAEKNKVTNSEIISGGAASKQLAASAASGLGQAFTTGIPAGFMLSKGSVGQFIASYTSSEFGLATTSSSEEIKKSGGVTSNKYFDGMYGTAVPQATLTALAVTGLLTKSLSAGVNASPYTSLGENVTIGFLKGMTDPVAEERMTRTAWLLKNKILNKIKNSFGIHSPATVMYESGEMITAGIGVGALNGEHYITDATTQLARDVRSGSITDFSDAGSSMGDAFNSGLTDTLSYTGSDINSVIQNDINPALASYSSNIDVAGFASTISSNLKKRMPSWDSIKSNFGFEKGISGNIQGVKNAWAQLKSAFTDEDGNLDLSGILGDTLDKLKSGLNGMVPNMSMNMEDLGINFTADSVLSDGWENEFSSWSASDLGIDDNIDLKINIDDQQAWDSIKAFDSELSTTSQLAANIPITGGYSQSTLGNNTYVNNYNYNQTNNSPTALSTREINRQAELMLMRSRNNRWNNGY